MFVVTIPTNWKYFYDFMRNGGLGSNHHTVRFTVTVIAKNIAN